MKLVLCLLAIPSIALAGPRFETLDRGDAIEVIARDVTAATTAVVPKRSRLEIELAGAPIIPPLVPTDKGVKVVELEGRTPRMLSVKVAHEREGVKRLARHARVFQVGPDVHVLFPRAVPADGATVRLPEPTLPEAVAAIAPVKPIGPEQPVTAAVKAAAPAKAAPEAARPPTAEPATAEPAAPKQAFLKAPEPSSNVTTYALLGLSAICVGAWFLKRKRAAVVPTSSTTDRAEALGAKAKVVWLVAGGARWFRGHAAVRPHARPVEEVARSGVSGSPPRGPCPRRAALSAPGHADPVPPRPHAVAARAERAERVGRRHHAPAR